MARPASLIAVPKDPRLERLTGLSVGTLAEGVEPISRVMMLVSLEGATMAETRVDDGGPEVDAAAEAQLREEAQVSGFSEAELSSARLAFAGDPPTQP